MKILNLVYPDKSDIKYKISKFPDGQQNIVINANFISRVGLMPSTTIDFFDIPTYQYPIEIKSRLNNFKDLELIIATVASLKELGLKKISLYVPYIVGARSDRKFEHGGNNYLKQVICPILNSLNLDSIACMDPHSHVLEALLNNFKKIDNKQLIQFALDDIYEPMPSIRDFILVSSDAGASHKIYKLAEIIGYKGDIITCSKERDTEGKLTKTVIPPINGTDKDFIIIDDICDGGRTFINIAKEIKSEISDRWDTKNKIYLIVTHGIFSNGFDELSKYFDSIYCTNSYSDIGDLAQFNGELQKTNLKQLNIF